MNTRARAPTQILDKENGIAHKGPVTRSATARTVLGNVSNIQKETVKTQKVEAKPITRASFSTASSKVVLTTKPLAQQTYQKPVHHIKPEEDIEIEDIDSQSEDDVSFEQEMEGVEQIDAMDIEDISEDEQVSCEQPAKRQKRDNTIDDIDATDVDDPQFCTEYVEHIFDYLRKVELSIRVDSDYMGRQTELNERHRHILVNWMVEVACKFKLLGETLFLAVNLLDRYLQIKAVSRDKIQLVGVATLLIACKFEEICSPQVKDFVVIAGEAYTADEILSMERNLLVALSFNVNSATPLYFLRRFSKAGHSDSKIHTLAKYIIEVSLLDYKMLKYLPSQVAAAAVYIARRMRGITPTWTQTIAFYSQYSEQDILPCVRDLNEIVKEQPNQVKLKAVYTKYSLASMMSVSTFTPVDI